MQRITRLSSVVLLLISTIVCLQPASGQIYRPPVHTPGRGHDGPWTTPGSDTNRWRLGVAGEDTSTGVRIVNVLPGSAADQAGLNPGDVIVNVDGDQVGLVIGRVRPLEEAVERKADPQGRLDLLIYTLRGRQLENVRVQLHAYRPPVQRPIPRQVVTGTVYCPDRHNLPKSARLDVKLTEVTASGGFIRTVAETSQVGFSTLPTTFRVDYDPRAIDPRLHYAVSATITINGRVAYRSQNSYFVITDRHPAHANIAVLAGR